MCRKEWGRCGAPAVELTVRPGRRRVVSEANIACGFRVYLWGPWP